MSTLTVSWVISLWPKGLSVRFFNVIPHLIPILSFHLDISKLFDYLNFMSGTISKTGKYYYFRRSYWKKFETNSTEESATTKTKIIIENVYLITAEQVRDKCQWYDRNHTKDSTVAD